MTILAEGYVHGYGDEAFIGAYDEAMAVFEEHYYELEDWLKENIDGGYSIEEVYDEDCLDVTCTLILKFELESDEMAFKLRWI